MAIMQFVPVNKEKLVDVLRERNLSLDEAAVRIGKSKKYFSQTLDRKAALPNSVIIALRAHFGITQEEIEQTFFCESTQSEQEAPVEALPSLRDEIKAAIKEVFGEEINLQELITQAIRKAYE